MCCVWIENRRPSQDFKYSIAFYALNHRRRWKYLYICISQHFLTTGGIYSPIVSRTTPQFIYGRFIYKKSEIYYFLKLFRNPRLVLDRH